MSPLNFPRLMALRTAAELEMIRAFRATASLQLAEEDLRLKRASLDAPDPVLEDIFADQYSIAEEVHELSEEFAIVAAYRVLELNARGVLRWMQGGSTRFAWPAFSQILRTQVGVDLTSLEGYASVDELRLLNNAIKHEGKVTRELAGFPGWSVGDRVHPLAPAFERLIPSVPLFIEALARAALPAGLGGHGPENHTGTRRA